MSWRFGALLAAVCLLFGSMWLLPESDTTPALELCLLTTSMVLVTALIGGVTYKRDGLPITRHSWPWRLTYSGIGSLSAPALLFLLGRDRLNSVMAVAIQASAPLFVSLATGFSNDGGSDLRLGPGLTALAGVLLVFPVALPKSSHGWTGFCCYLAATCLSATSSVACHREMVRAPANSSLLPLAASNALFLLVSALIWLTVASQWHGFAVVLSTPDAAKIIISAAGLTGVLYLLWLVSPLAAASRFVLAPLLAAIEAYVLLRPVLSFRALTGASLMLIGGLACLNEHPEQSLSASTSLR